MKSTLTRRALGLGLVAVIALAGCDELEDVTGNGDEEEPDLVQITVTADLAGGTLMVNETVQLTAEGADQFGDSYSISPTWSSDNVAVATVDEYGLVTAVGVGTARITASAETSEGAFDVTVAGTLHEEDIEASETWTAVGSPHVVRGVVYVDGTSSPILTLEAGALVELEADAGLVIGWNDGAGLRAPGTVADPIMLRSAASSKSAGDWRGIRFTSTTTTAELSWTTLQHCGAGSDAACISAAGTGTDPVLDNVTIELSAGYGVSFEDDAGFGAGSTDLTISEANVPVKLDADQVGTLPTGTYTGNTTDRVMVTDGDITASQTWPDPGVPYAVLHTIWIDGTGAPVLTLAPGTTLLFAAEEALHVGWNDGGGLVAEGTLDAPIIFGSNAESPSAGDWDGVIVHGVATSVTLAHVTLRHCGGTAAGYDGCLTVQDGAATVTAVTIEQSARYGVDLREGGRFAAGSSNLTVTGTALAPVVLNANDVHTLPAGTYTGNSRDVILVPGGTVETTQTWPEPGVPYVIDEDVLVEGTGTPVLTLTEGTTLRFGVDAGLFVGSYDAGELRATASDSMPIVFTADAASPSPGHWVGVALDEGSSASSLLDYVTIEYAGSSAGWWDPANLVVQNEKGAVLTNSVIQHSGGCGVLRAEGTTMPTTDFTAPALNNTFIDNAGGSQCDY